MATDTDEFTLTLEQAAVLFAGYVLAITRMEEAEIEDKGGRAAIPRDVLCVADAMMLIPAGLVLTAKLYPQLLDTEVLTNALRMGERPLPTIN